MRYERTYRDASLVVALGFVVVGAAALLLPIAEHGRSYVAEARMYGDRDQLYAGLAAAFVPALFVILTIVAALKEPNKAIRVIGRVLAFPCVLAVVATAIAGVVAWRTEHTRAAPWLVLAGFFGLAGLLAYAKSFFTGPWHAWAHVLVTPPATALAIFALVLAEAGPYRIHRLVGPGSNVIGVTIGIFVPLLLFVLFPRRRAV